MDYIQEMATEFDKVQFLGIDCVNVFPASVKPSNCEFMLGNVVSIAVNLNRFFFSLRSRTYVNNIFT